MDGIERTDYSALSMFVGRPPLLQRPFDGIIPMLRRHNSRLLVVAGSFRNFTGDIAELLLHQPADLEFDGSLFRNSDRLQRLGILSFAPLRSLLSKTPKSRNSSRLPFPSS